MIIVNLILICLFIVLGIIFGIQNGAQRVDMNFFYWGVKDIPFVLALIEALAVGMIVAIVIATINEIKNKNFIRRLKREIKDMSEELAALRNLPLEEDEKGGE